MPIRNYTLDDHKCEEDPSPNLIEYYDNLFATEEGVLNAWSSVTGTTSYDLESGYTYTRETGADCELKGFYDTIAIFSMEYRQCPDFLVLFGATLGIAGFVQTIAAIVVLFTFTRCGWAEKQEK